MTRSAVLRPGLVLTAGVATVAASSALPAFYALFSGFQWYDDEGYLLLSLRQYAAGGALYDQLYTQYGPAYFQLLTGLFGTLSLEPTHMAGRAAVMGLWLAVAALCALATHRLTGSIPLALGTQLLVFQTLLPMRDEPLHPGGVLAVLLSALVLAGSFLRRTPNAVAAALMGVLLAAAVLVKVNVGLFAFVSAVFVLLAAARLGRGTPAWRLAAAGAFVLVPLAVMGPLWHEPWVRAYLAVVVCAALAVVLVRLARPLESPGAGWDLLVLLGASALVGAASCGVELVRGTTVAGLWRGIVLDPLRHPRAFAVPLHMPALAPVWAVLSLGLAAAAVLAGRLTGTARRAIAAVQGPAQLLAGGILWYVAYAYPLLSRRPLAVSLPLLWLALLSRPRDAEIDRDIGRSLLVAVAVLQALHAYPVAVTQVAWATFLFIPAGAVAIAEGWRTTVAMLGRLLPASVPRAAGAVALAGVLAALGVRSVDQEQRMRAAYQAGVPLDLPGAERILVTPHQAAIYQQLTQSLTAHCGTFVSMPGMNSLYLFSRLPPPTMLNATLWVALFTPAQQAVITDRLSRLTVPVCAVRRQARGQVTEPRSAAGSAPDSEAAPLVRYIEREFVTLYAIDGYEFMIRRPPAPRG
jgi:hypothetical protein